MSSDPASARADRPSFWQTVRDFLSLKSHGSLRESIEEAIEEHRDENDDPDDLDLAERAMLRNMLDLSERKVGDIAVPRADIVALEQTSDFQTIVAAFREAGHSRIPLFRESLDEVIGMLHVKDVYAIIADRSAGSDAPDPHADALMRPVLYVPPSMPVVDLLTDMRRNRTHMAIVVDEYGGTDGLVTIEDIMEEIVGEIEDEHDDAEVSLLVAHGDGRYTADARLALEDLESGLGVSFADEELGDEVDTLGGLAFLMADRVPDIGDRLQHSNGWTLEIMAGDGRRVERLLLHPPQPGAD
jgi:CBS domain containing-hemolysin-like protein